MAGSFSERVALKASSFSLVRAVLTVLVAPLWLLGAVAGLAWMAVSWMAAAVAVGFRDAQASAVRASKPGRVAEG